MNQPSDDDAGERLRESVGALGGRTEGLRVVRVVLDGGGEWERAVYTTRPFAAGEVVLHVPAAAIVRSGGVDDARPPARSVAEAHQRLARWLLRTDPAAGAASARGAVTAYLSTLPRSLKHFPVLYEGADRAALAGTALGERVEARLAVLTREFGALAEELPGVAAAEWRRARTLVTSRAFACGAEEALVPLGDVLNHALDPGTTWTCDARQGWVLRATRDLPPEAELTLSYGNKSNARLLFAYGFTLVDNPWVDMEVPLGDLGAFSLQADTETAEGVRLLAALGALGAGHARRRRARARAAELLRPRLDALRASVPASRPDVARIRAEEARILEAWVGPTEDGVAREGASAWPAGANGAYPLGSTESACSEPSPPTRSTTSSTSR